MNLYNNNVTNKNNTTMAKKINITLFNNYDTDFEEYKGYYQECNDLTDEEMEEVSDNTIYDYIYDCLDMEWDDLFLNIKHSKFGDTPCVITGRLGLWHGKPTIVPVPCDDIEVAIRKCVNNMDYIIVKQVNGHIEVDGIHHDGRNHFEIHLLNNKGLDAKSRIDEGWGNADLGNKCYHKALNDYLF